jgi:hypothetical protein
VKMRSHTSAKGGCRGILPGYRVPGSLRTSSHSRREANERAQGEARWKTRAVRAAFKGYQGLLFGTQARLHACAVVV